MEAAFQLDRLVPSLRLPLDEAPEVLRGALESVFMAAFRQVTIARDLAELLVMVAGYDYSAGLVDVDDAALRELEVPIGRRPRVLRAIFLTPVGGVESSGALGAGQTAQARAHAGVMSNCSAAGPFMGRAKRPRDFRTPWPAPSSTSMPAPDVGVDFGMALREYIRGSSNPIISAASDQVFSIFVRPWGDLPAGYLPSGEGVDQVITAALMAAPGGLPPWAAPLIRLHMREDRGCAALLVLCRQILTRTDVSDAAIKRSTRYPKRESNPLLVAKRLAQWDSDLSSCVDVRGFTVDEHDRTTALLGVVDGLSEFEAVVAAMSAAEVTHSVTLRRKLGEQADKIKAGSSPSPGARAHVARHRSS
jgi:hypothetical protein